MKKTRSDKTRLAAVKLRAAATAWGQHILDRPVDARDSASANRWHALARAARAFVRAEDAEDAERA